MSSQGLKSKLEALKVERKEGKLTPKEFYKELLTLAVTLVEELKDEDISDEDIKKQTPLVLAFLEDQIDKMEGRGH
ncbi:MAG: hypothetical protein GXO18_08435 [Aquificae bacterium]|nr:hypothetical protein [Aquificota bacterium]